MSLKAKLEAVIYAAEEPVTLGQLAVVFAEEALALKAEQEAAAQSQAEEAAAAAEAENLPLLGEEMLPEADGDAAHNQSHNQARQQVQQQAQEEGNDSADANSPAADESDGAASEADDTPEAAGEEAAADPAQAEAEAKRALRARDREVRGVLKKLLDELIAGYAIDGCGIEIREIAGGYRMATKPECHDAVRSFIKGQKPALKLSLPALETLAVIAYKQPVTAPEVNEIRGVDSSGVFGSLLARKLIATAGRKQVVGRPILYKTTREFLMRFGLKDVAELPSMEEFEKMAASELNEPDADEDRGSESAAEFHPDTSPDVSADTSPDTSPNPSVDTNGNSEEVAAEAAVDSAQAAPNASNQ